jgi:hypothetical protein
MELGDFYSLIGASVVLNKSDVVNLVDAITCLLQGKEKAANKGAIHVDIEHLKEYNHLTLYISKHDLWTTSILFYNGENMYDFLQELETMAMFEFWFCFNLKRWLPNCYRFKSQACN